MSSTASFDEYYETKYDKDGDVLYVTAKPNRMATSAWEDTHGIVWRYDRNHEVLGATIQDFKEQWSKKIPALSARLVIYIRILPITEIENVESILKKVLKENSSS